jgi:hypothetical protein
VFLSHTSELRQYPERGGSFIDHAERAVSAAGHVIVDMEDFEAIDRAPEEFDDAKLRSCQVYVGIYGLRYGTPARNQPDKSYTELEFDTATALGLPRLVFVLDRTKKIDIPAEVLLDREYGHRQDAFLKRVENGGVIVKYFSNPDDLARLLERSLRALADNERQHAQHHPPRAAATTPPRQVPELLPYLADRHDQDDVLVAALQPLLNSDQPRPLVVIVHGDDDQLVANYRLRFFQHTIRARTHGMGDIGDFHSNLRWPDRFPAAEPFAASFRRAITHQLQDDQYTLSTLGMESAGSDLGTLVLWSTTNTDDWCGTREETLARICAFWQESEAFIARRQIHWISIQYSQPDAWCGPDWPGLCWLLPPYWFHRWRCAALRNRNKRIRAALQALARSLPETSLLVVPELKSVCRSDVEAWARSPWVSTVLAGREPNAVLRRLEQLEQNVKAFYRGRRTPRGEAPIPMGELADFLHDQLQQVMP